MPVRVKIPAAYRHLAGDQREISVEAADVAALIAEVRSRHPELAERICEQDGSPKGYVNIYVNEEDVRFLSGQETALADGDEVLIVPAIAGG